MILLCRDCGGQGLTALPMRLGFWLLAGLFALVAWRSWAGLLAGGMTNAAGLAFALAGAVVTWAGKAAGGVSASSRS